MIEDGLKVRGCFRVQIEEDGFVLGDSGWQNNAIVNLGFRDFLCRLIGDIAGSVQVQYAALGTGTAPGAADTTQNGELAEGVRNSVTAATSSTSKTVRFTGTFASGDNFVTATRNISNIGLWSTDTGGTLFAANTYASSSVATNQNVNYTYDITFS